MADELLIAQSNKPNSAPLRIVDGLTDTGYQLVEASPPNFGLPSWDVFYSGPRGTQGAVAAGANIGNRGLSLPLLAIGDSHDDLETKLATLWALDDDMRRFGGSITFRPKGGSFKVYYDVLGSSIGANFDPDYFRSHRLQVGWSPVCAPYLRFDPFDVLDDFSTDTTTDYTVDAGAGAGFAIVGGEILATTTGVKRWRHTARGYLYGDVEVTLKVTTGGSVVGYTAEVFSAARADGTETYIAARLTASAIEVILRNDGTAGVQATSAFAIATNTSYYIRLRRQAGRVTAQVFTAKPTPMASPGASASWTMNLLDDLDKGRPGHCGFRINVVASGERYDDFQIAANTYGGPSPLGSLIAPDEAPLKPAIPGDAPALADVSMTTSGGTSPIWALFAWWKRAALWNMVSNGDFEDDVDGWTTAGVSGVTGACTSFTRNTTAARNKYGDANGQIVCPATANTGVAYRIERRFKVGKAYLVMLWCSSAAGVTNARVRLGVSGDIASSSPTALSTSLQLFSAVWTPTADRDGAYVAAEITAATGTTWNIDAVVVVELRAAQMPGGGGGIDNAQQTTTVVNVPDDWPAPPFLCAVGGNVPPEIVRVRAINYATKTLTFDRAQEGTSAFASAGGNAFYLLPELRHQYEGKGGQPPYGIVEGESDDAGYRFGWSYTADANARLGNMLKQTGIGSSGLAGANYLIDPHLAIPDDMTRGEISVEVWARLWIHSGLTSPVAYLNLAPETATVTSGTMASSFGALRTTEEYGVPGGVLGNGKALVKPSSGGAWRFVRLGTLWMPVDRKNPIRSRLHLNVSWTAASSGEVGVDYLLLVPSDQRCLSPTARASDTNFPKFIASSSETTKVIRSDGSGRAAKPPGNFAPDHGLGGSLIELPPGPVDVLLKTSTLVPDDPTSDTSSETDPTASATIAVSVTPRGSLARGS